MVNHADPVPTTGAPTAARPAGQTARTGITAMTGYLYPWDVLADRDAADTILATGVDRVALAAAYHSVRAATPRHPDRRVVDAREAALYVRVGSAWNGQTLVPRDASEWTGTVDSFTEAAAELRVVGLPVDAWTVLTHSSALGSAVTGLCVVNAFGERYRHALCPSFPEVRQYAATVVEQVLTLGQPDGIILEAVGPLGFGHQNQHEKTAGAGYSTHVQNLLSLCFCAACSESYQERGIDADSMRTAVRDAVRWDEAVAPLANDNDGRFQLLLEVRWDATAALLDGVLAQIELWKDSAASTDRSGFRVSLHVSPDPWSTGPFVALEALRRSSVDLGRVTAVVPCWESSSQGAQTVALLRSAEPQLTVGSYVLVLPPKTPDAGGFAQNWAALADAGSSELHVYHLGLASSSRLKAVGAAVRTITDGEK